MRKWIFLLGKFLIRATETYVHARDPSLKDRLIIPNNLTGKVYIKDHEHKTIVVYLIEQGKIVYEEFRG